MHSQIAQFLVLFSRVVAILMIAKLSTSTGQAKEGCPGTCGNVTIPYPFGIEEGCFHDEEFLITCNTTYSPPKPFLTNSNIEVTNISLQEGELTILQYSAFDCYNQDGSQGQDYNHSPWIQFSKFKLSNRRNKFTVVGCDTYAFINGKQGTDSYQSGCTATCDTIDNVINGSCTGVGCCQTSLPTRVDYYEVYLKSYHNHTQVWNISSCGYAFVVQDNMYNFSLGDLSGFTGLYKDLKLPVVVDWAIGNETCGISQTSNTNICGNNSKCVDSVNGPGYRCNCLDAGYQGNPYLPNGCHDVDECNDPSLNQCEKLCINTPGNYTCSCPKGYRGDGRKDGHGCTRDVDQTLPIKIVIGILVILAILLVAFTWVYLVLKKRKLMRVKEKFFKQNGGVMLQNQLSNQQGSSTKSETIKIYTAEELEKATDSYSESGIIGIGGYGTVYKGILSDYRIVAIKKSKLVDKTQTDQFINEVIVLSQINHRNVVKLLGCCLETEVPLLVYEFIPNGTLYDHIHNRSMNSSITWDIVLRIASETAGVLSYLHSSASVPIIHRDVKSTNILLDENFTAKVSDFGASRLVPLDEMQVCTMVQGTLGYLDPEYMHTSQLTEKSDVYSFGVVLVELLTKRKVLCFEKPEKERNLGTYFVSSLKEGRLFQILDARIVREVSADKLVLISDLSKRCLNVKGEDRPSMKEVAMELEGLKTKAHHPWVNDDHEEFENFIAVSSDTFEIEGTSEMGLRYDSKTN